MTTYFDKQRRKWRYDAWRDGARYTGYCENVPTPDGAPRIVNSKRAADQAEAAALELAKLTPKIAPAGAVTIGQVAAALIPTWKREARWLNTKRNLEEILAFFKANTPIAEIGADRVLEYVDYCLSRPKKVWAGGPKRDPKDPANERFWRTGQGTRGPATTNLYLEVLRDIFARARLIRDPITRMPAIAEAPPVPFLAIPKRIARPVPDAGIAIAFDAAVTPHFAEAIELTLHFAFRRAEAFGLTRRHIDRTKRGIVLRAHEVKDAEDVFLAASADAWALLMRLDAQAEERGTPYLIARPRRASDPAGAEWLPLKNQKRAWARVQRQLKEKLGETWRWHDLRATTLTHVAWKAGPLPAQHLGRHSDYRTTAKYVAAAPDAAKQQIADTASSLPALKRRNGAA